MSQTITAIYAFVVGASIGSFLNVCIGRWPLDLSVVKPRSRCPNCGLQIAWYDNIPIVSWILLRAKCRGCALPISFQYPLVELLVGLFWLWTAMTYGGTFTALRIAVFGTIMLGIAITDFKTYLIPDGFTISGFVFVLVTTFIAAFGLPQEPFAGPWQAILGACVGAGSVSIVGWLGEAALKKEAMGFGDVTLMAVVGAALGPERALAVLFIGAALGAITFLFIVWPITRLRGTRAAIPSVPDSGDGETGEAAPTGLPHVPFGVFLAPAAMVALLWGEQLLDWYLARVLG